jgi:Cu-Zn family superoxide dismutase
MMNKSIVAVAAVTAVALVAAGAAVADTAKADMKDAKGASIGTVTLTDVPAGVLLNVSLKGLPAGTYGFHLHAVGKCEAPGFTTAGGHFNPGQHKHGFMSAEGQHAGDLPNLHVATAGDFKLETVAAGVTVKKGAANSLLDQDGAALVIHEKADDYKTDPAGDSGARIVCGVIGQ